MSPVPGGMSTIEIIKILTNVFAAASDSVPGSPSVRATPSAGLRRSGIRSTLPGRHAPPAAATSGRPHSLVAYADQARASGECSARRYRRPEFRHWRRQCRQRQGKIHRRCRLADAALPRSDRDDVPDIRKRFQVALHAVRDNFGRDVDRRPPYRPVMSASFRRTIF